MRGGEVRPTSGRSKCWLCQSGTNTQIGGASWLVYTHRWAIVLIIASELWRWLVMLWHSWRWGCANEQLPFIFISLVMVARKVHDIVKTCGCKEQIFFSLNITYLAVRLTAKNGKARNIEGTVRSTAVFPQTYLHLLFLVSASFQCIKRRPARQGQIPFSFQYTPLPLLKSPPSFHLTT